MFHAICVRTVSSETGANFLPVIKVWPFSLERATKNAEANGRVKRFAQKTSLQHGPEACECSNPKLQDYSELMFDKNSPFDFVLLSLSISNSMASTGDSGFSTFRSTQIRDRSSRGISSSSLRVPDR